MEIRQMRLIVYCNLIGRTYNKELQDLCKWHQEGAA